MQVQDFTVIRISPIVYNDRDILEIGVISHRPQTGLTNTQMSCMFLLDTHAHAHTLQRHKECVGTHQAV